MQPYPTNPFHWHVSLLAWKLGFYYKAQSLGFKVVARVCWVYNQSTFPEENIDQRVKWKTTPCDSAIYFLSFVSSWFWLVVVAQALAAQRSKSKSIWRRLHGMWATQHQANLPAACGKGSGHWRGQLATECLSPNLAACDSSGESAKSLRKLTKQSLVHNHAPTLPRLEKDIAISFTTRAPSASMPRLCRTVLRGRSGPGLAMHGRDRNQDTRPDGSPADPIHQAPTPAAASAAAASLARARATAAMRSSAARTLSGS